MSVKEINVTKLPNLTITLATEYLLFLCIIRTEKKSISDVNVILTNIESNSI